METLCSPAVFVSLAACKINGETGEHKVRPNATCPKRSSTVRWIVVVLLFLLTLATQTAIRDHCVSSFGASPDLMIILIVQLSLTLRRAQDTVGFWLMGLATDLDGDGPVGLMALVYTIISAAIRSLRPHVFSTHILTRMFLLFFAHVLQHVSLMISEIIRGQSPPLLRFWEDALLASLYTLVASLVLFPALSYVLNAVYKQRGHE